MQAASLDPGVHVVEPPLGDDDVEACPCPGPALPPPNGGDEGGLSVEPVLPDEGVNPGGFPPPEGNVGPCVCPGVALGFPPLLPGGLVKLVVLPWPWPGDAGVALGVVSLLLGVGVQLASIPGTHEFEPLGTFVEGSDVTWPEPPGPVGVVFPLGPRAGVVLGGTVFPPEGAVPGFSLPGVVLGPCP